MGLLQLNLGMVGAIYCGPVASPYNNAAHGKGMLQILCMLLPPHFC